MLYPACTNDASMLSSWAMLNASCIADGLEYFIHRRNRGDTWTSRLVPVQDSRIGHYSNVAAAAAGYSEKTRAARYDGLNAPSNDGGAAKLLYSLIALLPVWEDESTSASSEIRR